LDEKAKRNYPEQERRRNNTRQTLRKKVNAESGKGEIKTQNGGHHLREKVKRDAANKHKEKGKNLETPDHFDQKELKIKGKVARFLNKHVTEPTGTRCVGKRDQGKVAS